MGFSTQIDDICTDMNTVQPAYYRTLPPALKWEGVRAMSRKDSRTVLPKTSLLPFSYGMYSYVFSGEGNTVVKRSPISFDLHQLLYRSERHQTPPSVDEWLDIHSITGHISQDQTDFVNTVFLHTKGDAGHFKTLSELFSANMVEQSIALVLERTITGTINVWEVMVQPMVEGRTLAQMIPWYSKMMHYPEISKRHMDTFIKIAQRFREMIESKQTDENPKNFIITPHEELIYIDYQVWPAVKGNPYYPFADSLLTKYGF